MYPTLYHAFLDLFGVDIPTLKFLNSFGFFVAIAFVAAHYTLAAELRRKTGQGLLNSTQRTVIIGEAPKPVELAMQALVGFIVGWKLLYIVFHITEVTADPPAFLLSGKGSIIGGLLLGGLFAGMYWREKKKHQLEKPEERTETVPAAQHAGNITLTAALWGFIGAKLFHWLENPDSFVAMFTSPNVEDIVTGLTMYGGLILAGVMVMRYFRSNGLAFWPSVDAAAPGVLLAYGIGRIGCQVSGDGDWGIVNSAYVTNGDGSIAIATMDQVRAEIGRHSMYFTHQFGSTGSVPMATLPAPSWLPEWLVAYAYPHNVNRVGMDLTDCAGFWGDHCRALPLPAFPTPLYESITCVLLFGVLWLLRKRINMPGIIFSLFLIFDGVERFLIEKIRVNEPWLGTWTQAEVISSLLVVGGAFGLWWFNKKRMQHLSKLTEGVIALSRDAAAFIRTESARFTEANVESKSLNNLVSYVDKGAELRFVDGLSKLLPEAGFIAEEGTGTRAPELNWVIDPLDGTTNFIHGIPCYCTSVALMNGNEVLLGVVLEVTRQECFSAWKGGGALLNGTAIRVSARKTLAESLLATGFPYDDFGREAQYMDLLRALMHNSRGIRRLGSAAADLAYVACGRFEAFYEYGLNPWDVAAGALIVQEAGGTVTDFSGGGNHVFGEEIVASNGTIHPELIGPIGKFFRP